MLSFIFIVIAIGVVVTAIAGVFELLGYLIEIIQDMLKSMFKRIKK